MMEHDGAADFYDDGEGDDDVGCGGGGGDAAVGICVAGSLD